jgi:hypothetical protein
MNIQSLYFQFIFITKSVLIRQEIHFGHVVISAEFWLEITDLFKL